MRRLLFADRAYGQPSAPCGHMAVLGEGQTPSFDYYVGPYLARLGVTAVSLDSRVAPHQPADAFDGAVVIRYLPRAWVPFCEALRRAGKPVVYFMDDDLMDASAHTGLPRDYREKLQRLARGQRKAIERVSSAFWVSTAALAEKYRSWSPMCVPPENGVQAGDASPCVSVCYHGTASHVQEQQWLLELVQQLQQASDRTHFFIVGDAALNQRFRVLPRVTVVHPMDWPGYLAYSRSHPMDIGLAPLLPSAFNAARGPTKFFDFARLGAAGIYADVPPYRGTVRHDEDGLLVPMVMQDWVDTILALVEDAPSRVRLLAAARARVMSGPLQ